jgi:DNA-3-methyladenine glycosylase
VSVSAARRARRGRSGTPLSPDFYDRPTEIVARELLGAILERRSPDGVTSGRIVETEAYLGPDDPACHAAAGLTKRNEALFGPPGTAYVYFIYGMHWCVNAVTRERGHGSAVLIRALEPLEGLALMQSRRGPVAPGELVNGPAKLCAALAIDGRLDGVRLDRAPLRILEGSRPSDDRIAIAPRIGITQAADWPLRFFERDNPHVSRAPAGSRTRGQRGRRR